MYKRYSQNSRESPLESALLDDYLARRELSSHVQNKHACMLCNMRMYALTLKIAIITTRAIRSRRSRTASRFSECAKENKDTSRHSYRVFLHINEARRARDFDTNNEMRSHQNASRRFTQVRSRLAECERARYSTPRENVVFPTVE